MSERIFLSGGLGFIGHNLALQLKAKGFTPIVFDNFSQNIQNAWHQWVVDRRCEALRKNNILIIRSDTLQPLQLEKAIREQAPSRIVHLAAIPSIVLSNQNPSAAIDHNITATRNMLEIIRLHPELNIKQFVFFSSSTVYGDFKTREVSEESPTEPKGIYGASKLASEFVIKAYHNLMGLPYTILRPSALYGQGCINNRVSQIFIERALSRQPIKVEGDGSESLDFTYIKDLINGTILALTSKSALNKTFNITYGSAQPIKGLLDILKAYKPDLKINYTKRDKLKPLRGTLQINKAKDLLNYSPQYDLAKGYSEYIEWYLASPFQELISL